MVVSITFVLFLVGLLGILLINSKKVADHFKEQIALTLFIKDDARPMDVTQLQKSLQLEKATRQVIFVSKEEAAAQHALEIGEDFMEYLGYNPLLASIDVYFNAQYVTPDFIADLSTTYAAYSYVGEVYYDQPLLELLSKNIQKMIMCEPNALTVCRLYCGNTCQKNNDDMCEPNKTSFLAYRGLL